MNTTTGEYSHGITVERYHPLPFFLLLFAAGMFLIGC